MTDDLKAKVSVVKVVESHALSIPRIEELIGQGYELKTSVLMPDGEIAHYLVRVEREFKVNLQQYTTWGNVNSEPLENS